MTIQTRAPKGLQPVPVRITSHGREAGKGATSPYYCTLDGVLKYDDSADAPNLCADCR